MAKIVITINAEGQTKLRVVEVEGKECTALTKNIESKIGEVVDRTLCSDYYEKPKITNSVFYKKRR